jgi:hypothetical protein
LIHQPKLLKNLEEQFGPLVAGMKTYKTPAAPRTNMKLAEKGEILISPEDYTKFWTVVGMLLYVVKHSRPDIANSVQELSNIAHGATKYHWNKLLRNVKFTKPEWDEPIKMVHSKPDCAIIFEMLQVDNVGSIYLATNFSLSQNTKHIDIHQHFVWEHQKSTKHLLDWKIMKQIS